MTWQTADLWKALEKDIFSITISKSSNFRQYTSTLMWQIRSSHKLLLQTWQQKEQTYSGTQSYSPRLPFLAIFKSAKILWKASACYQSMKLQRSKSFSRLFSGIFSFQRPHGKKITCYHHSQKNSGLVFRIMKFFRGGFPKLRCRLQFAIGSRILPTETTSLWQVLILHHWEKESRVSLLIRPYILFSSKSRMNLSTNLSS